MIKFWKPFRVVVSLITLVLFTFLFIDFRQLVPVSRYGFITYLQFVPSVSKFIIVPGFFSVGFILIMLLTLIFGRVYCSVICPLGMFQDVISFISKKCNLQKKRFKYKKPLNILRYAILALTILSILWGSTTLLGILDPYSAFGRLASDLGKPVYNFLNNSLANVLLKFKIYSIAPVDIKFISRMALTLPVVSLLMVVGFSMLRGRLYCNAICPVGTMLGLLSKISIFKIIIDKQSCTQCSKCAFACKASCINVKEQKVDASRCVGCFNCLQICDKGGIRYQFAYRGTTTTGEGTSERTTDSSKRAFLAKGLFLGGALVALPKSLQAKGTTFKYALKPNNRKYFCTPPGSRSLIHFNSACTSCHLCVTVCPSKVLQPSFREYGIKGIFQPFMDYHTNYCQIDCTRCSEVCPTGAILPLTREAKKNTQIGIARFIKTNCVVYNNETACGACSEHCPTQAVSMVPYKGMITIPQVNEEICIGCGACEHACPVRPHRAIYVEGNAIHGIAKKPEIKKVKDTSTEEFPF